MKKGMDPNRMKQVLWSKSPMAKLAQKRETQKRDRIATTLFLASLTVMVAVGGYAVSRMISTNNHQKKWNFYDDCGWA